MKTKHFELLLPHGALDFIKQWVGEENLIIKIRNARKTKLGDYKFLKEFNTHQITINKEMTHEGFFFVLTHEIAHLMVRVSFSPQTKAHGKEWKYVFGKLLLESIKIYPQEFQSVILRHARNPRASLGADRLLMKNLFLIEEEESRKIETLTEKQKFRIGKRIFEKGKKRKIRYLCKEIQTGKLYTVSGNAIADEIFE